MNQSEWWNVIRVLNVAHVSLRGICLAAPRRNEVYTIYNLGNKRWGTKVYKSEPQRLFPRFNDINDLTSWEGKVPMRHPSITLHKSIQEGAIICSMCLDVMSDRGTWPDMCPYSDRDSQFVGSKRITRPICMQLRQQKHGISNQHLYMIWIFLHFNWVLLLTRSFPIPTSSSFVMDVSFCRIWSLKAFTSLLANHRAPSPTPAKVNMSPEKGPC